MHTDRLMPSALLSASNLVHMSTANAALQAAHANMLRLAIGTAGSDGGHKQCLHTHTTQKLSQSLRQINANA